MPPRDRLTSREMQVATLVWEGRTNRDIAKAIGTT
jgi:DNA-binding NarL/FixJ family response regulator